MPRPAIPAISLEGQQVLVAYTAQVQEHQDLAAASHRNYLSDLRQFIAGYEAQWATASAAPVAFDPQRVTTATLTRYRDHLQTVQQLRPASVNRALTSLKRFFTWAVEQKLVRSNSAAVVKWVREDTTAPPQLTDQQEDDLIAAVLAGGNLRDRTLITLMLHTEPQPAYTGLQ